MSYWFDDEDCRPGPPRWSFWLFIVLGATLVLLLTACADSSSNAPTTNVPINGCRVSPKRCVLEDVGSAVVITYSETNGYNLGTLYVYDFPDGGRCVRRLGANELSCYQRSQGPQAASPQVE